MTAYRCHWHSVLSTCTPENCWQAEHRIESRIEQTHDEIFGPVVGCQMFPRQPFSLVQIRSLTRAIRVAHEHGIEMDAYPVPLDLSWRWRLRQWWRALWTRADAVARLKDRQL